MECKKNHIYKRIYNFLRENFMAISFYKPIYNKLKKKKNHIQRFHELF